MILIHLEYQTSGFDSRDLKFYASFMSGQTLFDFPPLATTEKHFRLIHRGVYDRQSIRHEQ